MPDENIFANVSRPYFLDTHEIFCTCSIGIIVFADTHCKVSDVLQQADFALSQAKAAQKNEIRVFTPQ